MALRTNWTAFANRSAPLSWFQAFLRAGPMSSSNVRRTFLPSECAESSGSAARPVIKPAEINWIGHTVKFYELVQIFCHCFVPNTFRFFIGTVSWTLQGFPSVFLTEYTTSPVSSWASLEVLGCAWLRRIDKHEAFGHDGKGNLTNHYQLLRVYYRISFFTVIYIMALTTSCVEKIFISTMSSGHLFISHIFSTQIFILKKSRPPWFSNSGPLNPHVTLSLTFQWHSRSRIGALCGKWYRRS